MLNLSGPDGSPENTGVKRKAWRWMLIDSAIIGGIALAAVMGNTPPGWAEAWVMLKAFTGAFVLQLAIERGLKR